MPAQPTIHIRSMRIRVPGATADAGEALAQALRAQLGDLAATRSVHLGAMNLRVPAPGPAGMHAVSGAITSALANHLTSPAPARHA
jgi:hypothetical protein